MNCILIVNRNGVFSALPSKEEFNAGGYLVTPSMFLTFEVEVNPDIYDLLYQFRANLIVIGPGLPLQTVDQITDPNHYYALLQLGEPNTLDYAIIPPHVHVTFARDQCARDLMRLCDAELAGRFPCEATGVPLFYESQGFLARTVHAALKDTETLLLASSSAVGPLTPVMHTPQQLQIVADTYNLWYNQIQRKHYDLIDRLNSADSIEEIEAVRW